MYCWFKDKLFLVSVTELSVKALPKAVDFSSLRECQRVLGASGDVNNMEVAIQDTGKMFVSKCFLGRRWGRGDAYVKDSILVGSSIFFW